MVNYSLALILLLQQSLNVNGFISPRPTVTFKHLHMAGSFTGGGGGRNGRNKTSPLDDWLEGNTGSNNNNKGKGVSGQNERADNRLPLSFFGEMTENNDDNSIEEEDVEKPSSPSALAKRDDEDLALINNPYLQTLTQVPPAEIIYRFTSTASPRVQEAVKSTILSLIGTLPRMGKDATGEANFKARVVTSAERLASLMFQLQLTGYMFKNAEYRMAISKQIDSSYLLPAADIDLPGELYDDVTYGRNDDGNDVINGQIKGKLNVKYAKHEIDVDAESYVSELKSEIKRLREEMLAHQKIKQDQDLLSYVRSLPPTEMNQLTNVSQDVITAMKGLVNAVMAGIANDDKQDDDDKQIAPDTILEQSGEAIAQLCMWQLVSGFNLRELEIREQMKASLKLPVGTGVGATATSNQTYDDNNDNHDFTPGLANSDGME